MPNQEIFRRIAGAMGLEEPELFEPDRAILDEVLQRSGLGIEFDGLKASGTVVPWSEPLIQFEDCTFPTESGKIELASAGAERDGHPRLPLPLADPPPNHGKLRLLTPASKWQMNDSYGNDDNIRRTLGPPCVYLNRIDIERLGLQCGQPAELHNDTGQLTLVVEESDRVAAGVALAYKGRWPKLEGGNVNWLNPGEKSDMGESSAVHGVEVSIRVSAA